MLQKTLVSIFQILILQKAVNTVSLSKVHPINDYKEQKITTFKWHFPNIFHRFILNSDFTTYIDNIIYLIYSATTESGKCVKIVMVWVYHNMNQHYIVQY